MSTQHVTHDKSLLFLLAILLILLTPALASGFLHPVFNPELSVDKTEGKIQIDGDLSDPGWADAAELDNFVERYPGDNTDPEVATTTRVTYDEDYLYIAFVCLDDPQSIRATMCQRDQFHSDDEVAVLIDTYGDASWAYEFFVNAYGVQKDNLWSNVGGEDSGFDMIWHSAAHVTDSGYQVEIALPFAGMRFPNRPEQVLKMDFYRTRPRESRLQYSWAAYDRNESCWPCQWGTLSGIQDVQGGSGLEILPTYIAFQSGELADPGSVNSGFDNGDVNGEMSLAGKYAISSDVTMEAAYNPDFSQIEGDAAQVDVNTTISLFYPERRPFFQEGADVFRTLFNSFYTRTVNDPEYAVKLVSRKPGFTLGVMSAQDETTPYLVPLEESSSLLSTGRSWVNVVRGTRPVGNGSQVGFIVSDRRLEDGGYNSILALDGDIRLSSIYSWDAQLVASYTGEQDSPGASARLQGVNFDQGNRTAVFDGESFSGNALITRFKRFARHWSFMLNYSQVDPSYRTLTGYDPWVDYRDGSVWSQYTFYPEGGLFQRIQPQIHLDARWSYDGVRRWERQHFSINNQLRWAQTWVNLSVSRGSEAWTSRVSGDLIEYNNLYDVEISTNSRLSAGIGYYLGFERGRSVARFAEAVGDENSFDASLSIKPMDRLVIEQDLNWVRSTHVDDGMELYRQFIAHTRFRLQVNRELSVRLVVQYDDSKYAFYGMGSSGPQYFRGADKAWDIDPLITYRLSSFTVLHAGSTHDYSYFPEHNEYSSKWKLSSRQFFVKLQYLFQV